MHQEHNEEDKIKCTNLTHKRNCACQDNVIPIGGITKLDLPVGQVLEAAKDSLDGVVLMGYDKKGELYFASTYADGGEVLWLVEKLKKQLLEVGDGEV